jgi:hypothetical protein
MTSLPELDEYAFKDLIEHLSKHNIPINKYRKSVGDGRSQAFGMVRKRSMPPDLSRNSWCDPRLHYLLMLFARLHVNIPFTSIQVNDSLACMPHRDIHNVGESYIVAFGNFMGGELVMELPGGKKEFNIRHRPMLFNGSEITHSVNAFTGRRWSLVYHTIEVPKKLPMVRTLNDYEAVVRNGEYVIAFYKPGEPVEYLSKKNGLPHPLKGRVKKIKEEPSQRVLKNPNMTLAQNLMLDAHESSSESE